MCVSFQVAEEEKTEAGAERHPAPLHSGSEWGQEEQVCLGVVLLIVSLILFLFLFLFLFFLSLISPSLPPPSHHLSAVLPLFSLPFSVE